LANRACGLRAQILQQINKVDKTMNDEKQPTVASPIEPVVSCDELQIICNTVVKLTELKLNQVAHLCIENFAQECLGKLLSELRLNKDGLLRAPDDVMHESN
jgi:hypothetical protein